MIHSPSGGQKKQTTRVPNIRKGRDTSGHPAKVAYRRKGPRKRDNAPYTKLARGQYERLNYFATYTNELLQTLTARSRALPKQKRRIWTKSALTARKRIR